jgi:hypothetical protein
MSSLLVSKSIKTNLAQLHPYTTLIYTFEGISNWRVFGTRFAIYIADTL